MAHRHILLLLLLSSLAHSASAEPCNGSAYMLVPAVVGDGSGLINLSVRMIPGNGEVFLSAFPETGTSTQQSVEDAVQYAFRKAGVSGCDAVMRIDTVGSAAYVEGPSAGAALTVLSYAALEGVEPRRDAVLTGTIDPQGDVGPVGGLYEKALAAATEGETYFVTPRTSFFETLMLRGIRDTYGLKMLEAGSADDAIGFMLFNGTLQAPDLNQKADPVPDIPNYDDSGMPGFDAVTARTISLENAVVQGLPANDNDSRAIRDFYASEVQRQGELRARGYLFTAANEAFLDYVDASTVSAILAGNSDSQAERAEAGACLSSLPDVPKTERNFEWVVGADLRRTWAEGKLNGTQPGTGLFEDKYITYRELMYADAWCRVSGALRDGAGSGGNRIDESAWKTMAADKIAEADKLGTLDSDGADHLASARESFAEGAYGAAIYDATYAAAMYQAGQDMSGMKSQQLDYEITKMLRENRTSLWGSVYQSQAAYMASDNLSDRQSAFTLLRYAAALDDATARMRGAVAQTGPGVSPPSPDLVRTLLTASIFLITIMLLSYLYYRFAGGKRRSDERNPDTKRPYRVSRAKQKQG